MDLGWLWCVNIGSSVETNITLVGDVDNGEGYACVGVEKYMDIVCTFPSIFPWI